MPAGMKRLTIRQRRFRIQLRDETIRTADCVESLFWGLAGSRGVPAGQPVTAA
jgi:hypothetical protein